MSQIGLFTWCWIPSSGKRSIKIKSRVARQSVSPASERRTPWMQFVCLYATGRQPDRLWYERWRGSKRNHVFHYSFLQNPIQWDCITESGTIPDRHFDACFRCRGLWPSSVYHHEAWMKEPPRQHKKSRQHFGTSRSQVTVGLLSLRFERVKRPVSYSCSTSVHQDWVQYTGFPPTFCTDNFTDTIHAFFFASDRIGAFHRYPACVKGPVNTGCSVWLLFKRLW